MKILAKILVLFLISNEGFTEEFNKGYLGLKVSKEIVQGAKISSVTKGSPAFLAGIRTGDVIIEIDQKKIINYKELFEELSKKEPLSTVKLKAFRKNKEISFKLVLINIDELKKLQEINLNELKDQLNFDAKNLNKKITDNKIKNKNFDLSKYKTFLHLAFWGLIIAYLMHRNDKKNQQELERRKEYFSENDNFDYNNFESNELFFYAKEDFLENVKGILVFGQGQLNIPSNKLKNDGNKVKLSVYVSDVTEDGNSYNLKCEDANFSDQDKLLCFSKSLEITDGSAYPPESKIAFFPNELVIPAKKGERKLNIKVFFSSLNSKFDKSLPKKNKNSEIYIKKNCEYNLLYKEPGFLEVGENNEAVNQNIIELGLALANTKGKINQSEINIIKEWIKSKNGWNIFDYLSGNLDLNKFTSEENFKKKAEMSHFMRNAFYQINNKNLSMSAIVGNLNNKATSHQKFEAIKLMLDVAGSDDKLSISEDKLINKTARALYLDEKLFQEMKSSALINISNIEHSETMDETVFNLTDDMSKSQKCKKLREEYSRWNRQTNNSNLQIREKAKKLVELAANLRKKYDC